MSEGDAVLRDYRPEDLDAIVALDMQCFTQEFRFDHRAMRSFAEASNAVTLIVEDVGREIVGFAIVHMEGRDSNRCGYLVTLDVTERRRNEGLATRLVRETERRARAANGHAMGLHVHTENAGAIRFYERNGYRRVGVKRVFYGRNRFDVEIDAFVYRKEMPGREELSGSEGVTGL